MNLENSLYYFTHHSESIIQWLFLLILLISAYVIGRAVFAKKEAVEGAPSSASVTQAVFSDGSDVQVFLKKILDQTSKLETVNLQGMSPKAVGEVDAQVQTLKKDLQAREEELKKLKTSAAGQAPAADTSGLSARIKELEAKLSEYEILEDDIADLSLYKEENVRLRSEMDKIKGIAPTPPAPSVGTPGEDIVAEFAQAVRQDVVPAPAAAAKIEDTGNPMVDFESAVKLEKKIQGDGSEVVAAAPPSPPPPAAPAPPPVAAPTPPPTPVAAAAAPAPASKPTAPVVPAPGAEGEDLFAEFANPPPDPEGHSLDTDKMMAEMAALVSLEPTKGTALGDEIDTDKMAAEASRLGKA